MYADINGSVIDDGSLVTANGQWQGSVGAGMEEVHFNPWLRRPFRDNSGVDCVMLPTRQWKFDEKLKRDVPVMKKFTVNSLRERGVHHPVLNAATLPMRAWIEFDNAVVKATRQRLRAWTDLVNSSSVSVPNAMGRMTYEYQSMTDAGEAVIDMDMVAPGRTDNPKLDISSIPLPVIHSDFFVTQRQLAISRQSNMPLDTTMAEMAGRRVAEMLEKLVIGVETGPTYGTRSTGPDAHVGTSTIYGYTNFPYRVTKTDLNAPTGSNPEAVLADILEMIETMNTNGFYGPFILYHSTGYSRYLNDDYFRTGSTSAVRSLRQRLMEVEELRDIRRLDYLTSGSQLILVQMDSNVASAIQGSDIQTIRWEERGGGLVFFKTYLIGAPLLKRPYSGVAAIIHATTA